ncbi:Nucleolar protein [Lachnellula hyalina]|uniref:Nucleolar protein n=1 Tax=Lachnellula hyalina TaxID=1316788 RepID=A0A8H8R5M2_9HELO|nr:Nucleolar protein [Lachnellula hyalina]TVY28456.1 Nucleolar protein [Lachnellula hyalina]
MAPSTEVAPASIEPALIKPKKEKKEKRVKTEKKEKSSKKRKAESLQEPVIPEVEASPEISDDEAPPSSPDADETSEKPSKKRKTVPAADEIEVDITAPEPPSKKALRALKKGKPLPPSKSGADSSEPKAKKEKPEVEKRSEHGVWIGNLPFFVSKDDLRTFLVEKSDLTEALITRIHMPGPNDKKSANKVEEKRFGKVQHNIGFSYVDFSTAEAVEEAMELSEQLLGGRRVLIKNNKSFEGRPEKTKEQTRMEGKPPSKRAFVGNLAFDVTEDSIKEFFEKCGAIESVKLATFEDSGKCKGYGWIVFEELEAAQNAVRGFIMVEEEESDASESEEDSDSGSENSDEEKEIKPKKAKKTKKRKVWVNRIKGRPLRMEFAEDAQVRYKKRYGKDGTKRTAAADGGAAHDAGDDKAKAFVPKVVEYREAYAPRLTGGIVESKGKKVTF